MPLRDKSMPIKFHTSKIAEHQFSSSTDPSSHGNLQNFACYILKDRDSESFKVGPFTRCKISKPAKCCTFTIGIKESFNLLLQPFRRAESNPKTFNIFDFKELRILQYGMQIPEHHYHHRHHRVMAGPYNE